MCTTDGRNGNCLRSFGHIVRRAKATANQALLLHLLLHRNENPQTPGELASRLGYAKMTMTRALNELEVEQL